MGFHKPLLRAAISGEGGAPLGGGGLTGHKYTSPVDPMGCSYPP